MKGILKFTFVAVVVLVGILGVLAGYFFWKYPDVDKAADLTVQPTPEKLARGAYLANHVSLCIDCHSKRNWELFSAPTVPGTEGMGGFRFAEQIRLPGVVFAKNITPAGIGTMTDGELYRAITSGVRKDGQAMLPLMPYPSYNKLSEYDLESIIAYIKTLKPLENAVPESELDFPLNFIVRTTPSRHAPIEAPDTSDRYEYGRYLVNAAVCANCHTREEDGKPLKGMEFAGGREFLFPEGVVRTSNITPDEETGIGAWSADDFVARFKYYASADTASLRVEASVHNTPMPWVMYRGMTERDLEAIYKYLRTISPVKNEVEKFTPTEK